MATTSVLLPLSSSSSSSPLPPPLLPLSSSSDSEDDNDTSYLDLPDDEADVDLDPRDASTRDRWVPRHPSLIRLTGRHPFNSEAPLPLLLRHGFLTPSPIHFVRNHGHVPSLPHDHRLHLSGLVPSPSSFSASDLALRFRPRELPVTLVCAGNRRREQNLRRQSLGFNWGPAAVSTAVWRGARLRDVLLACGVRHPRGGRRRYVWFEGAEDLPGGGGKGSKYGTSLRLEVAMAKESDVILAYAMNGRDLAPDHGYPVRLVVPGHIGGRMVKWLTRVVVADEESPNHYHYKDNRVLPSHVDAAIADAEGWWYKPEYIINELNINSVITTPSHDEMFAINSVTTKSPYTFRGYAYSGGGRKVTRVEVTMDGGETWKLCELEHPERPTKYGKYWCWCFWSIQVEVLDLLGAQEIAVRAWDESQNTQPEKLTWNVMGMMNNCWFRVKIIPRCPARGEIGLLFEHPTVPGNQSGGWMTREKHLSSSSLSPSSDVQSLKKTLSTPTSSPRYTLSEVSKHSSRDSAWIVVHDVVYDCTPFLKDHPGGADSILINAGTDCTEDFDAIHSDKAKAMLDSYRIGEVLPTDPTTPSPAPSITAPSSGRVALTSPREKIHCTLVSKTSIAHNVRLFRFTLPSAAQVLGLPVGKHVLLGCTIDGKRCMRAYTPTSHADEVGHFDLVVKIYENGLMSRHLDAVPVGSAVDVKGPAGHVEYRGRGELVVHGETRRVRRVALVAGGTGVTPMYQVMQAAAGDEGDETEMRLVFANSTDGDVFMRREIDGCVEKGRGRVSVRHVVGKVTGDVLRETVPPWVEGETLALVCGPPGMTAAVKEGLLGKLGYDEDSVVLF